MSGLGERAEMRGCGRILAELRARELLTGSGKYDAECDSRTDLMNVICFI